MRTDPTGSDVTTDSAATTYGVVELRQYTLHPAQRDSLIELFDREFVETQEAVGMAVIGQFRDLDDPDRFVWLRGFVDMPSRAAGLAAFYGGPVWAAHRDAANATMIDSGNVLLLRPYPPGSRVDHQPDDRPVSGASDDRPGLVVATIYYLIDAATTTFPEFFDRAMQPIVSSSGITVGARYVTESTPNNFPPLPVREDEHVFAWTTSFADAAEHAHLMAALESRPTWHETIASTLHRSLTRAPEVLRLVPTARSLVYHQGD